MLRLHPSTIDYVILGIYFVFVLGIGFVARSVATALISGVNLFALALIIHLLLGWSVTTAILVAAAMVLIYITLGGLTSAIYNEVLQFFVIVAALLPLTLVALHAVGGIHGLVQKVKHFKPLGEAGLHASRGLAIHHVTNPLQSGA